jgi:hypothetical protein
VVRLEETVTGRVGHVLHTDDNVHGVRPLWAPPQSSQSRMWS